MVTSEERIKILEMVQQGKISADEGAKLLAALGDAPRTRRMVSTGDPRWMRVRVTDTFSGKSKVSVNLPLSLVDAGLNIASSFVPDIGIDEIGDAIRQGLTGKIVDVVDDVDGEHVEIYIE